MRIQKTIRFFLVINLLFLIPLQKKTREDIKSSPNRSLNVLNKRFTNEELIKILRAQEVVCDMTLNWYAMASQCDWEDRQTYRDSARDRLWPSLVLSLKKWKMSWDSELRKNE
jgi:hypothetical protein